MFLLDEVDLNLGKIFLIYWILKKKTQNAQYVHAAMSPLLTDGFVYSVSGQRSAGKKL